MHFIEKDCQHLMLLASLLLCATPVQAADRGISARLTSIWPSQSVSRTASDEFVSKKLKEPPKLPGVPYYPGRSSYISGVSMPNTRGGSVQLMLFRVAADKQSVLSWYGQQLQYGGWTIERTGAGGDDFAARSSDGNHCIINTAGSGKQCTLSIYFREVRQTNTSADTN